MCGEKVFKSTTYKLYTNNKRYYILLRVPKKPMAGGDYGVAIDKKDGKILKMWAGA